MSGVWKRLAQSAERVITLQESASSVDEEKNVSIQSQFLPVILVNHCFTVQLTPEVDSVHAIQGNIPSKITATMKLKGGPEINFQIDTGAT